MTSDGTCHCGRQTYAICRATGKSLDFNGYMKLMFCDSEECLKAKKECLEILEQLGDD